MLTFGHFLKTLSAVLCELLLPDEQTCDDGLDNDEDCLVDLEDSLVSRV